MMRKFFVWSLWIILSLLLIICLAVVLAPAKLLLEVTDRWVPQVKLSEPSGTVWNGESSKVVVSVNATQLDLGKVSWDLSIFSVLMAKPSLNVEVEAEGHQAKAHVSATLDQVVTVDDVEGSFPLSMLEPWVPLLVTGDLAFVVDHVVFNPVKQQLLAVDGALNLQEADWIGGDEPMPLGSYIAQVSLSESQDVLVQINDFSAMLGIEGDLTISPAGSYQFDSVLQARDGLAPEVAQSVSWFGKKNSNGDVVINYRGRWH